MSDARPERLVQLEGVVLGYGRRTILSGVDLAIDRGEFVGIIGANGSGKTTLLRGLLGLVRPIAGRVLLASRTTAFGYVQQRQFIDDIFPLTVAEVASMGRLGRLGPLRRASPEDRRIVLDALRTVGVEELADASYRELSGGQKQRTLLARALASQPDVLVLDEPTNDMDVAAEERILQLVQRIRRESGVAVVLVTHLLHVVLHHADRLALVHDGRVTSGRIEDVATTEGLSRFYGVPIEVGRLGGRLVLAPGASGERTP